MLDGIIDIDGMMAEMKSFANESMKGCPWKIDVKGHICCKALLTESLLKGEKPEDLTTDSPCICKSENCGPFSVSMATMTTFIMKQVQKLAESGAVHVVGRGQQPPGACAACDSDSGDKDDEPGSNEGGHTPPESGCKGSC